MSKTQEYRNAQTEAHHLAALLALALAQSGVSYTINFYDSGTSGKSSTDSFGIRSVYTPVAPQPSTLPNTAPQLLKGGDIKVS